MSDGPETPEIRGINYVSLEEMTARLIVDQLSIQVHRKINIWSL